jgi:uncharacterized protein
MTFFPKSAEQWIRFSALALVAVSLLVYVGRSIRNLQYRLLYYPSPSLHPEELLSGSGIKLWRPSGSDYRGLIASNQPKSGKGTVIVFHGNGGTASDRTFYQDVLGVLGYRVILAEYPSYGGRKGEVGEKSFVEDGSETVRLAYDDFGGPVYILGESLGSGVAAAVVRNSSARIGGVILITPWDTLASVAAEKFPFLPVRLFLKDEYDSIKNLATFGGRIAVVAAGRDSVIPVGHAQNLYDSLSGTSKRMWTIEEAEHNDWYAYTNMTWWKEIMEFVGGDNGGQKQ